MLNIMNEKKGISLFKTYRDKFERLKSGLSKTRSGFLSGLTKITGRGRIDEEFFEELEELLITADVGVHSASRIISGLREDAKKNKLKESKDVEQCLKERILSILNSQFPISNFQFPKDSPFVIMIIGVNGSGKTTTIGKLASKYKKEGKKVLLAAGDTFRAAAIEQLEIWGERSGCPVIKHQSGADPSAVIYDAIQSVKARGYDIMIADTAGRLHTKVNLMEEMKKIKRIMGRELPGAPHEILMVLDATTGQNAISQAKLFNEAVGITGIALTKLDGTAKGGVVINIIDELKIPVKLIGVGESIEDLREFEPEPFVEALFER
ncbi:MAG: signal recognition particle-docking protein FtsY [Nitrospinae bacterium]|nr:signal recognition particle-docking protein FtsY [Nitrospinota bacterium]MBI3815611.1 signal recognition particle-docking protein FtsY [Nitrospinota bacterium]